MQKLNTEEITRISLDEFKNTAKIPLVVVLDNVRSLHNVGAVFRTADAYLVEKICLCGITAVPPNAEIHKSALGAEFSVDWQYFSDTLDAVKYLKDSGFTLLAIEQAQNSTLLNEFQPEKDKKYAVILGNEVFGVQQSVINECAACLELPQFGTKHSLNVSVTAGIVIWEFFAHR
ncbi:MAG: RNA methyltransferase [Prevotellaceae bacterium]|jgi:tRNA G18 (ribose-2'-O)-methylase SpoU|nr:RNA methyltransferase [Prevotellaceae bacterium]